MKLEIDFVSIAFVFGSYLTAIWGGHLFVKFILRKFDLPEGSGLEKAGAMIGYLERALILTFILVKEYMAIGLVLTAKSITRFEELKDRSFSEYFLIGTLSSVLFASLTGVILSYLLK